MNNQGYITIATGSEKFLDYAVNLRLSCLFNDPDRSFALLADDKTMDIVRKKGLDRYFDQVIFYNGNRTGLLAKLDLYNLSPFDETIFIDADSLMIKNPNPAWKLVAGRHFIVQGRTEHFEGKWAGRTEKEIMEKFEIPYVIRYNGGLVYFDKSVDSINVFKKAHDLVGEFEKWGFYCVHDMPDEEPIISVAMTLCGLKPLPDSSNVMFSPIGRGFWLNLSIPRRRVSFRKYGVPVSPIILHCCAELRDSKHYSKAVRELHKIMGINKCLKLA